MSADRIQGLRAAVAAAPDNHVLRLMLAELLEQEGRPADALVEYERLRDAGVLDSDGLVAGGRAALAAGRHDTAMVFVEAASAAGEEPGAAQCARREQPLVLLGRVGETALLNEHLGEQQPHGVVVGRRLERRSQSLDAVEAHFGAFPVRTCR